jgi:putative membrane protein
MKKIRTIIIMLLLSMTIITGVQAAAPKSIDAVMSEIRTEQGVGNNDQINPDRVSQAKLEELGDSVMEAMIGDSAVHEQMDARMGGEGSASLTAMHVRIGYNYLTNRSYGMMGNYSPTNSNEFNNGGMMGYFGWGGTIIMGLFLIVFIIILIVLIKRFTGKQISKSTETPLDILNKRYVLGEITKDDYERIKGQLGK